MPKRGVHFKRMDKEPAKDAQVGTLTVKDLQQKEKDRHKMNKETYREILKDCENRIRYHSSLGNKRLLLKIPYVKFDRPLYDITHAIMYVIQKLKKNGFTIVNVHENGVYISWG